jgi:hypothetical protein
MNDGLEGMYLDSALFDNFFTPDKDKSSSLRQKQKDTDITQSTLIEDLDIASIDDIFTQSQIFKPAKPNDVEVEMVKDAIEQSEPFPGKRKSLTS